MEVDGPEAPLERWFECVVCAPSQFSLRNSWKYDERESPPSEDV